MLHQGNIKESKGRKNGNAVEAEKRESTAAHAVTHAVKDSIERKDPDKKDPILRQLPAEIPFRIKGKKLPGQKSLFEVKEEKLPGKNDFLGKPEHFLGGGIHVVGRNRHKGDRSAQDK